jgi:hypothetical protein
MYKKSERFSDDPKTRGVEPGQGLFCLDPVFGSCRGLLNGFAVWYARSSNTCWEAESLRHATPAGVHRFALSRLRAVNRLGIRDAALFHSATTYDHVTADGSAPTRLVQLIFFDI